ncbi:hypothetical protein EYF80_051060 [Liparis tanakae]|uniref:Uncharacterized protein n=1 Tax=Liparis tanakae TaxID=230148 RepID=A0A4Z2FC68_9TELE|nr:hypothetical protein EYF80_051060 [Liparis tanakae]
MGDNKVVAICSLGKLELSDPGEGLCSRCSVIQEVHTSLTAPPQSHTDVHRPGLNVPGERTLSNNDDDGFLPRERGGEYPGAAGDKRRPLARAYYTLLS